MNAEIKRHIDAARQVLVGVVPNPASQIDQITYALIYKFMDDMDQAAIKGGDEPAFFIGDLEPYSWARLMDPKIGNQDKMNLYVVAFQKFTEAKQLPDLFRNILKSAFLPYRSPETLGLFLKEIDYFDYSHSEELGEAYEYLLSIMSSQGDAGQFRTPRHIIDFIVDVVNPTKDDKVLDPACGTGGFLVSSYKHILEQHDGKNDPEKKEKKLTPDERRKLMNNFEGYDIDPSMARIAQVNMYLHQFKNPKIVQYDTLSSDERWGDKFDVILANPPFMSPKGGIKPHSKFSIPSSRSEVLFVDYIMSHLRPRGRAGIIVPEGIIFQSGSAHKKLRKNLVEDGLYAIVSLPSGVFAPYSGVKTSILLFNNELSKVNQEILFIKITHDGTDLGAKKRLTAVNDLIPALESIKQFERGQFKESEIAQIVSKQTILDSGDYNLSGDRYKISAEVQSEFELIELGNLIEERSERVREAKNIEVWSVSNKDGFVLSNEYFAKQVASTDISNYKIVRPGYFAYNPSRINVGSLAFNNTLKNGAVSPMYVVFSIKENTRLLPDYLFSLLKSEKLNEFILQLAQGAVRQQLRVNDLKIIKIPLPSLEIQEQIQEQINGYQKIVDGIQQAISNWKPVIDIDLEWRKVKLSDISDNNDSKRRPVTKSDRLSGQYPYYGASGIVDYVEDYIFDGDYLLISEDGANLLARSTPIAFSVSGKSWVNNHAHILKFKNNITQKFVETYINQIDISKFITGMAQPKLNQQALNSIEIPLPPPEIQKQIVEKIEIERNAIEQAKTLQEIFEQKIKDVIAKLWNE